MKKIVNRCWIAITGQKLTKDEKLNLLAQDIAKDLCLSAFEGKKLTYAEIAKVTTVFNTSIREHLADCIDRHNEAYEDSISFHNARITEAETALRLIEQM